MEAAIYATKNNKDLNAELYTDTEDESTEKFINQTNQNGIPKYKLRSDAITMTTELKEGKSYRLCKLGELGNTCDNPITISNTKIKLGKYVKNPYFYLPTLKNKVASMFGMGGKKSRKNYKTRRHTRRRKSRRNSRK